MPCFLLIFLLSRNRGRSLPEMGLYWGDVTSAFVSQLGDFAGAEREVQLVFCINLSFVRDSLPLMCDGF